MCLSSLSGVITEQQYKDDNYYDNDTNFSHSTCQTLYCVYGVLIVNRAVLRTCNY